MSVFLTRCATSLSEAIAGLVGSLAVALVVLVVLMMLAGRSWWSRSLMSGAGRAASGAARTAGRVAGAAMSNGSRPSRGDYSVMLARLDVGGLTDVTVVVRGDEGIRQGDELVATGIRVLGSVRAVMARNLTTGRTFVSPVLFTASVTVVLFGMLVGFLNGAC